MFKEINGFLKSGIKKMGFLRQDPGQLNFQFVKRKQNQLRASGGVAHLEAQVGRQRLVEL